MLVLVLTETTVPVPSRDTWEMQIPGPPRCETRRRPRDRAPGGCRGAAAARARGSRRPPRAPRPRQRALTSFTRAAPFLRAWPSRLPWAGSGAAETGGRGEALARS